MFPQCHPARMSRLMVNDEAGVLVLNERLDWPRSPSVIFWSLLVEPGPGPGTTLVWGTLTGKRTDGPATDRKYS